MKHDRWLDNLSRLFDDDLAGDEKNAAEAHLKSCADCAETWRRWMDQRRTFSTASSPTLGPGFRVKVMEALDQDAAPSEPRLTWAPWLGLAAAAALTLAVSLPAPETETASADPTGLMSLASANTLPNNPMPDWITEANP
jgi:anti-sigma factor RsiW